MTSVHAGHAPVYLGIDVGSASAAAALVGADGRVEAAEYRMHKGKVRETLADLLRALDDHATLDVSYGFAVPYGSAVLGTARTSCTPEGLADGLVVDPVVALVEASRTLCPAARSILSVGAERFSLVRLDAEGRYRGLRSNTSCAAGTGSFLDQQARRLGFPSVEELARRALACSTPPAKISTRCAVFARTDLVHAQQAGHSLEEISDGLCAGLARSIADTLLAGEPVEPPVVFAGGVSRNTAVKAHLEKLLGAPLIVHDHAPVFGAIGAALRLLKHPDQARPLDRASSALKEQHDSARSYVRPPLTIEEQDCRGRESGEKSRFDSGKRSRVHPVEVDVYDLAGPGSETEGVLGIDVGSTSTKAMLIDSTGAPRAGFYAATLGSPLTAVQALCEALEDTTFRRGTALKLRGVAVTGAGRKLIGALSRADLVVDEITAHARAASALDPDVDTIIEIGGQDAKFTTMSAGVVTFCHMNTVCAAGTGSFLEEQAARLGRGLDDYEKAVSGARAPLSSDRCAVFMERDINAFLSEGFSTPEILAAALYSVRDNYLSKVARGAAIGTRVAFQGATARNGALVAAFRQALGVPIFVSRYCHLTGALGAALLLQEKRIPSSTFVGLASLRDDIPIRSETCGLCANHCRLRVVRIGGQEVEYGHLCGRDASTERYVDANRSGFDLLKERARAFLPVASARAVREIPGCPVVGLPAALGLYGELPLWKAFFSSLGVPVVTSEGLDGAVERGRAVQGAEFCAPIAALHGHAAHLLEKADYVFLPVHLEERDPVSGTSRLFCYYTQFSSALASAIGGASERRRFLMPRVDLARGERAAVRELGDMLRRMGLFSITRAEVAAALRSARSHCEAGIRLLQNRFQEELAAADGPSVVLLGRPYNVIAPDMGKGIPGIFGSRGVKAFSQDMVPYSPKDVAEIAPLLSDVHWHHAAKALEAALVAAKTPGLYPVYVTSFKCSPDSFALEYFRRILDARAKPYLVLQLDDHDSTLGYETRIEAGVASFRNHMERMRARAVRPIAAAFAVVPRAAASQPALPLPVVPRTTTRLDGRTLLFPVWDPLVNPLLAAGLRREGVDARVLEEDSSVIRAAMRHNTGQCIPLNVIVEEAARYVERHDLDPARTALWMARSRLACNIGMFPSFIKSLLEARGAGMERMEVYTGSAFYLDFSLRATISAYHAYLAGGLLRRLACRIRPREKNRGDADRAVRQSIENLIPAFEGKADLDEALRSTEASFASIPVEDAALPKVAIFGDLYVRDNDVMNQGLIACLEEAGAEVVTTPYTDYVRIVASAYFRKWLAEGNYAASLGYRILWKLVDALGRKQKRLFEPILSAPAPVDGDGAESIAGRYGVRSEHAGESFDNLLKVTHLARAYPDLVLFVQASPAFCCPSLVTEAMAREIEAATGVPVVSVTYDGTGRPRNDAVVPYVVSARERSAAGAARLS